MSLQKVPSCELYKETVSLSHPGSHADVINYMTFSSDTGSIKGIKIP